MISKPIENPIVAISVKVYQALLVAYPTKFQREYGSHMVQVFRDCCLRTVRQSGANGLVRLWAVTLFDFVQSIVSEHAQKEIEMKKEMKPRDIRLAGGALIIGTIIFALSAISQQIMGFLLSMVLLAGGVLGLRSRYGEKVGEFGRNILLIGVILGSLISLVGLFGAAVDPLWILIVAGPATLFACLALFGVVALYKKPMSRWNLLPLLAGVWFPIIFVPIIIKVFNGNWYPDTNKMLISPLYLQGIALIILGYVLISDTPDEVGAIA
jgi:hypothetical protein